MDGKTNRKAHFSTVIALIIGDKTYTFEGRVDGSIDTERRGTSGFGYDPIFVPDESGISFAEMSADDKNAISHRGRATAKLLEFLNSRNDIS
jgi:XTP/dITP diphosphohydrolase